MNAGSIQPALNGSNKELFKTAQKWVGQTFFGTILKQMHNSPFKSELWSGGRGGEAFSSLYDQHLAERMARGAGRGLANAVVKHIQRNTSPQGEKRGASPFSSPVSSAEAEKRVASPFFSGSQVK